jgi:cytochrome c oxidase cbb3-type subunit 3
MTHRTRLTSVALAGVLTFLPIGARAQDPARPTVLPQGTALDLVAGKRAFDVNCARCHGIGGTGDTGPNLAQPVLQRARNDTLLRNVIANGIPGTEMPNSFWLSDADVRRIAAYVRSLGAAAPRTVAGSAANGKLLYDRLDCATCHIVNGVGGAAGPELSSIGARRSPAYLRRALTDPPADFPRDRNYQLFAMAYAVPRDGRPVLGVRVNEDTYTIQVRDADGRFYSFRKADLKSLERRSGTSPMPAFRDQVSDAELNDLVAYLTSLRVAP